MKLDNDLSKIYEILNVVEVKECDLKIYELVHIKTKAKILLYETDDDNKVFNICFKTPVDNNKGTPHILEHSVLCGSRKYDIKDPFVELAKSSMNTFLNAMTFPDKTCYPVASTNLKDFENLMDVYLDAVFFPNIYKNKKIFMQEGWHYEIEDEESPLTINGVVLNEMRGAFSDPQEILESSILKTLYAGTNYMYEYGGEPRFIKDLSYDEFLNFHKKYYSPTNSIISLYGNLDFNKELKYIDLEYLSKFEFDKNNIVDINSFLFDDNIKENDEKSNVKIYDIYFNQKKQDENICSYNFKLKKEKDSLKMIVLSILDYILFVQEGSIIKDKIINEKIVESVNTIIEFGLTRGFYSVVLYNMDTKKISVFLELIKNEINRIIEDGIDVDKLEAGINAIYFNYIDNDTNYPKGLKYILSNLNSYIYDGNIDTFLKFKKEFDYIKSIDLNDKNNIFYEILKEIFLDNLEKNFVRVLPKADYFEKMFDSENKKLIDIKESLTSESIRQVIKETKELKKYQNELDDLEKIKSLPKLDLSDIEKNKKLIDFNLLEDNIVYTEAKINDLVYFSVNFSIDVKTDLEKYVVAALSQLLTKVDTKNFNYKKLNEEIDKTTGLFSPVVTVYNDKYVFKFTIKTLISNIKRVHEILYEVLFNSFFDENRVKTILNDVKISSNMSILSSGHITALNRAMMNFSTEAECAEKMLISGISFNMFINDLMNNYDKYKTLFIRELDKVYKNFIKEENVLFNVCMSPQYIADFKNCTKEFIKKIKDEKKEEIIYEDFIDFDKYKRFSNSEAFFINSDVNFVARAGKFDKEKYSGILYLIRTIMNYEYLWKNIRVLGGAYGMSMKVDRNGNMGFTTFRDPNLINSDKVFKGIGDYIKNINIDDRTIENYKIGTIASIDNPISNLLRSERNFDYYLSNRTNEYINKIRKDIMDSDLSDIKEVSKIVDCVLSKNEICSLVGLRCRDEAKEYYKDIKDLTSDEQKSI